MSLMRISVVAKGPLILPGLSLLLGLGWYLGAEAWLGAQSPGRAAAPSSPSASPDRPPWRMESAARLYRQNCVRCHDRDFTGSAWRGAGRRIPDFTSGPWHQGRTDAQLLVSILEGKGTRMPAFSGKLSEGEARDLVLLIRQANPTRPTVAEADPTDFTRRYAALVEELEQLRKLYRELARTAPGQARGPGAASPGPKRR